MIQILDTGICFVLYDEQTPLGKCFYEENRILKIEGNLPKLFLTALVKSALSKIEKQGYEKAQTKLDLSDLGFVNGEVSLIGYFKNCD